MSRYPDSCSQNIQVLQLLVFSQKLWVCNVVGSELVEQRLDIFLHVSISLIVDIDVLELIVVLDYFSLLLDLLYFRLLLYLLLLESVQLVFLLPPLIAFLIQLIKLLI